MKAAGLWSKRSEWRKFYNKLSWQEAEGWTVTNCQIIEEY